MKRIYALLTFMLFIFLTSTVYATTYTVKDGDTLHGISKKLGVSISALKEANNLQSDKLRTGTKLKINVSNKKPVKKKGENIEANGEQYHAVKKGDTLKKIAKKYSISVKELKQINNLRTNGLRVSQKLLVKNLEPKTHVVKKGDTIWKISKRYDVSIEDIKELNDLKGNSLKEGQRLLLARKKETEEDASPSATYDKKKTPVIVSAKIQEVKELSTSNELSDLDIKERLVLFAKKMLHLPYKFGGNGIAALDCSSYVQKVYSIIGINLPRSAREQFKIGDAVNKEELSVGDLVFFRTYASFPSHVGIYLGNNLFIHASSKSKIVTIDSLETPYYFKRFIGAKRLLPEDSAEILEISVKEHLNPQLIEMK